MKIGNLFLYVGGLIGFVNESSGGLMPSSGFIQRSQINSSDDYNNFINPGIHDISSANGSLNSPGITYGVLIVSCNKTNNRIIQMVIEVPTNILYIRSRTGSNIWSEWRQL